MLCVSAVIISQGLVSRQREFVDLKSGYVDTHIQVFKCTSSQSAGGACPTCVCLRVCVLPGSPAEFTLRQPD